MWGLRVVVDWFCVLCGMCVPAKHLLEDTDQIPMFKFPPLTPKNPHTMQPLTPKKTYKCHTLTLAQTPDNRHTFHTHHTRQTFTDILPRTHEL